MKTIGKRLVIAAFAVFGGLSLIAMASPSKSVAAPGFRPVMPMHAAARPVMPPRMGPVMTPQQLGRNSFLGGTNFNAFRFGEMNGFATGSGFNGFTVGGLGAFNRTNFLRGVGIQNATLGSAGLGFTGLGAAGLTGFGFTGFASGLGATPFVGGAGFGATGAIRVPTGFRNTSVPMMNGFQNLNGFGAFGSPITPPAFINGTKFGFNGSNGL